METKRPGIRLWCPWLKYHERYVNLTLLIRWPRSNRQRVLDGLIQAITFNSSRSAFVTFLHPRREARSMQIWTSPHYSPKSRAPCSPIPSLWPNLASCSAPTNSSVAPIGTRRWSSRFWIKASPQSTLTPTAALQRSKSALPRSIRTSRALITLRARRSSAHKR